MRSGSSTNQAAPHSEEFEDQYRRPTCRHIGSFDEPQSQLGPGTTQLLQLLDHL